MSLNRSEQLPELSTFSDSVAIVHYIGNNPSQAENVMTTLLADQSELSRLLPTIDAVAGVCSEINKTNSALVQTVWDTIFDSAHTNYFKELVGYHTLRDLFQHYPTDALDNLIDRLLNPMPGQLLEIKRLEENYNLLSLLQRTFEPKYFGYRFKKDDIVRGYATSLFEKILTDETLFNQLILSNPDAESMLETAITCNLEREFKPLRPLINQRIAQIQKIHNTMPPSLTAERKQTNSIISSFTSAEPASVTPANTTKPTAEEEKLTHRSSSSLVTPKNIIPVAEKSPPSQSTANVIQQPSSAADEIKTVNPNPGHHSVNPPAPSSSSSAAESPKFIVHAPRLSQEFIENERATLLKKLRIKSLDHLNINQDIFAKNKLKPTDLSSTAIVLLLKATLEKYIELATDFLKHLSTVKLNATDASVSSKGHFADKPHEALARAIKTVLAQLQTMPLILEPASTEVYLQHLIIEDASTLVHSLSKELQKTSNNLKDKKAKGTDKLNEITSQITKSQLTQNNIITGLNKAFNQLNNEAINQGAAKQGELAEERKKLRTAAEKIKSGDHVDRGPSAHKK